MKTIFYSTKDYELPYLESANKTSAPVTFVTDSLSVDTAHKAEGYEIVSIFTADDASSPVLELLYMYGFKYIAIRAAGYDNVDLKKAASVSLRVANVPEYSPFAIAEHATALLLALNRKIIIANKQVHEQNFTTGNLIGFDLNGKTVGIIGAGKIGSVFAKIMNGFGCRILACDIRENKDLINYGVRYVQLRELCKESNIISIHTSLNEQTKYLVNKKIIAEMQPGVILINTSRGGCVNTADIIEGLENGHIGCYGADVYENEKGIFFYDHSAEELKDEALKKLLSMPNVLITPHQAFATKEALTNIADTTFYNLQCWENDMTSKYELSVIEKCRPQLQV